MQSPNLMMKQMNWSKMHSFFYSFFVMVGDVIQIWWNDWLIFNRFPTLFRRLLDEVESLEAILMDDVKITKNAAT